MSGPMLGRVRFAGALRVRAEPFGSIASPVVEKIFAIMGGTASEPNRAVLAEFLGECHEKVGEHLVVRSGRASCRERV